MTAHRGATELAVAWWSHRTVGSSHLRGAPVMKLWRDSDDLHVRWRSRPSGIDAPAWCSTDGDAIISVQRFGMSWCASITISSPRCRPASTRSPPGGSDPTSRSTWRPCNVSRPTAHSGSAVRSRRVRAASPWERRHRRRHRGRAPCELEPDDGGRHPLSWQGPATRAPAARRDRLRMSMSPVMPSATPNRERRRVEFAVSTYC
jgi:uncharacterized protein DUF5984